MPLALAAPHTRLYKEGRFYVTYPPSGQMRTLRCPNPSCDKRLHDFCFVGILIMKCRHCKCDIYVTVG